VKRVHTHYLKKKKKRFTYQLEIGLPVPMRESSVTTSDRRLSPRTKLVEIAYIGMGPENGGLVLDVSDGGLSFHTVAPVQKAETICFLLSLRGHSRIEGTGEVVWTNEMKTVCGLRFTSLSTGAREYLNHWTDQSRMAQQASRGKVVSLAPRPAPEAEESPDSLTSQSVTRAESVFSVPYATQDYFSVPTARSIWREPLFFLSMFAILGIALAVTTFNYGVRLGKLEIGSEAQSAAARNSPASPQVLEPAAAPASFAATDAPNVPASTPEVPSDAISARSDATSLPNEATSHPDGALVNALRTDDLPANSYPRPGDRAIDARPPDQRVELASDAGKSELAAALAALRGANGIRDSSKAARLLWAAIANHNSTAEVVLADLYLRGDGVTKSCEQGRVLLLAASRSGDVQASEKLAALYRNGCP
jgi:PilZ domain